MCYPFRCTYSVLALISQLGDPGELALGRPVPLYSRSYPSWATQGNSPGVGLHAAYDLDGELGGAALVGQQAPVRVLLRVAGERAGRCRRRRRRRRRRRVTRGTADQRLLKQSATSDISNYFEKKMMRDSHSPNLPSQQKVGHSEPQMGFMGKHWPMLTSSKVDEGPTGAAANDWPHVGTVTWGSPWARIVPTRALRKIYRRAIVGTMWALCGPDVGTVRALRGSHVGTMRALRGPHVGIMRAPRGPHVVTATWCPWRALGPMEGPHSAH